MADSNFTLIVEPDEAVQAGAMVRFEAHLGTMPPEELDRDFRIFWYVLGPRSDDKVTVQGKSHFDFDTTGRQPGAYTVHAAHADKKTTDVPPPGSDEDKESLSKTVVVRAPGPVNLEGVLPVSLQRTEGADTSDQVLWTLIRNRTEAISFRRYRDFINGVMCRGVDVRNPQRVGTNQLNFTGTQAYEVLKQATDSFLMQECGVLDTDGNAIRPAGFLDPDLMEEELLDPVRGKKFLDEESGRYGRPGTTVTLAQLQALRRSYYEDLATDNTHVLLPYLKIIRDRLSDLPLKTPADVNGNCYGILRSKLTGPLAVELLWSYWHEEGMLVQTLNAILARFQNRRLAGSDPLARFDLDPLRPMNNLFWGWAEDEYHRLTVRRRAFEYDHEYGLALLGRAVPDGHAVDSRSNFVQSLHTLLNLCSLFFKEDDDTTVLADGFPLLNALRETHLILAEGAHNQFGDLPSASRAEMLIMQWLLARPEMREFLGGRVMVPYAEDWMDRVDSMKQIQGWTEVSSTHFHDLAVFGEQLVLSIRYGNWSVVNDRQQAANWARYWRAEIQRYTHAYRTATGVDLTKRADGRMPAHLLNGKVSSRYRIKH